MAVGEADVSVAPAGLTWKDDITQEIISQELSHVPTVSSVKARQKLTNRLESSQLGHNI